jgi:hypothetical protein
MRLTTNILILIFTVTFFSCSTPSTPEKKEATPVTIDSMKVVVPETIYYPDTALYTDKDSTLIKKALKEAIKMATENIDEKDLYLQSDYFSIFTGNFFDTSKLYALINVKNITYYKYTYIYEVDKLKFKLKMSTKNDVANFTKDSIGDLNNDHYNDYLVYNRIYINNQPKDICYIWLFDPKTNSFVLQNKNTLPL